MSCIDWIKVSASRNCLMQYVYALLLICLKGGRRKLEMAASCTCSHSEINYRISPRCTGRQTKWMVSQSRRMEQSQNRVAWGHLTSPSNCLLCCIGDWGLGSCLNKLHCISGTRTIVWPSKELGSSPTTIILLYCIQQRIVCLCFAHPHPLQTEFYFCEGGKHVSFEE